MPSGAKVLGVAKAIAAAASTMAGSQVPVRSLMRCSGVRFNIGDSLSAWTAWGVVASEQGREGWRADAGRLTLYSFAESWESDSQSVDARMHRKGARAASCGRPRAASV
ncbi:hypothetical protein GCM10010403_03310 [Glycomyces rutgersensis]|uniref:Uncharacterized protein n=1 Tax=Glycomyces rutgersensis TaxID=58115 RepID=A0ABN3F684_9ACTN